MAIKVIIMDIDGTLVNDEKVITPLTKETLLKAQDKGVRLVLASGRPTSGLLKLAEELDMRNHHASMVQKWLIAKVMKHFIIMRFQ